ncbi:MAG: patatin-like phospholipase family protein [Christensenellaceae bacterium]|jgi:NTE family protein|nr:patatin-like phospholipase family protein [Christensenellaceae bacterium]
MLGLVLEGGGAKGAFHAGVVKALFEHGYQFDAVMGTSIGAINGAMIAQGDFELSYKMWQTVTPSKVMDVDDVRADSILNGRWTGGSIRYLFNILGSAISNKGMSTEKLRALLNEYIDEDKLRASKIDFGVVTVDTSDKWFAVEIFKNEMPYGTIKDYILASARFPAFRGDSIGGKRFIDGGVYDNLPINPLIRRGYNHIIAVRTMSNMPHQRVIDASVRVDYIQPSEPLGTTLAFTTKRVNYNLKMGYFDGLRYVKGYAGKEYYIECIPDLALVTFMSQFREEMFTRLATILNVTSDPMDVFSALCNKLNKKKHHSFGMFQSFIVFLEIFAEALNIDRFQIFNFPDFLAHIVNSYIAEDNLDAIERIKVDDIFKTIFLVIVDQIILSQVK